jgi:phage tail sheath gpL-like
MGISTAIPPGSIASGVGVKFNNVRFNVASLTLPQRIAVLAQASDGVTGFAFGERLVITNATEAGTIFGFGSPIHSIAKVLYNPSQSVGTIPVDVYPVEPSIGADPSVGSIAATGTQTETQDYVLIISTQKLYFTITAGTAASSVLTAIKALIDANINVPLTTDTIASGAIPLTSKWSDVTANKIVMELVGVEAGITITLTQMSGGTGNALVSDATDNFGEVWETLVVNQYTDTTSLDIVQGTGEDFWKATVGMPFVSFYGSFETDPTTVSTDTNARLDDRINSKFPVPGSSSLPFEIAASLCAYVAIIASQNPPKPYYDATLFGILPGSFSEQWPFETRDYIEKRGCSTSYIDGALIKVGDALTCYHPVGVDTPGYRYVVDVVKSQFILKGLTDLFSGPDWQGKILVDDDDQVTNPEARKPSSAKAGIYGLIDQWADLAVIVNRDLSKENTVCEIDPDNANRINSKFPAFYSGAARERSVDIDFTTEVVGG